jgi:uncharacterized membrane protein
VFGGLVVALVAVWLSLTPSLLPRDWLFQGVVGGASAAIGYGVGVLLSMLIRYLVGREPSQRATAIGWRVLAVAAIVGTVLLLIWFAFWQNELRDLMETGSFPAVGYPLLLVIAAVLFVLFVAIARGFARATRWVSARLNRVVPQRISAAVAVVMVVVLTIGILNGVVIRYVMSGLNESFAAINAETDADTLPPTSRFRSGGPGSVVDWDSLGRQGRFFVSGGSSVDELTAFNRSQALEPIRVYAGLASAGDFRSEADLVAEELERVGGFSRAVVAVGTSTGTGWINESTVSALEYLYNGNTAVASMQYSYLPSPISFLVDQERAKQAGRALFEAIYARWSLIPEKSRPKLVVFGESLGSFGGESAFTGVEDLAARANGALFIGPTYTNKMWEQTTDNRDRDSPQWLPIYDDGQTARFVARPADLDRPQDNWPAPRVVYLQHPSDPITWWSPGLLFAKPDWLREPRGYDVLDSVRWIPVITFLQVSADMAVSNDVPDGHGHTFHADIADSWAAILQPEGWTASDTQRLREVLTARAAD